MRKLTSFRSIIVMLFCVLSFAGITKSIAQSGTIWKSRASAANISWRSVTYGNGLFVAVASSGTGNRVMTSPDGITWTTRTSAADNSWYAVTYGNGLFVAVANSGTGNQVMTSPDGINWTTRTSAADNSWDAVTYGNGLFVAVAVSGSGNRVMTSPDGITWTTRTSAADNSWHAVTYGNGLFVAVANSGTGNRVMTSPDGITWTTRTSAADNLWYAVTYGNGLFVAVAASGTGNRVMTSPDGIAWTTRTSSADNQWYAVAYGNGLFVAVASTGTVNRVMTSPDGITWTTRTAASNNNWGAVTYGNGLFVAVSNTGTGNRVMTSSGPATGLNLDGVDDYIKSASDVPITGNAPRTMEISAQFDNPGTFQVFANWGANGNGNVFGLYLNNSELTFLGLNADFGTGYIVDNAWHHYAVTYDGTNVQVYVDGVATPNTNVALSLNTTNSPLLLGQFVGGSLFTGATIDEVRVWNRVLPQAEIAHNMSCSLNGPQQGLVIYYPLNQGIVNDDNTAITTAKDSSSNSNDGVLNNFTLTGTTSNWSAGTITGSNCGLYFVYNSPEVYKLNIPHTSTPAVSGGTANNIFSISPALPAGLSLDVNTGIISGTATVASSATDYTVTATNATTITTALINIAVTIPVAATGLNLDGVDDYVQSGSNVPISGAAPRTLEITAQLTDPSINQMLANWGDGNYGTGFGLYVANSSYLYFYNEGNDLVTNYVVDNNWHHYALVYDGTTVSVYVDGVAVVSQQAFNLNTTASPLLIGKYVRGGLVSGGNYDEVRIWNRALSNAEITHNMSCALTGSLNGLVLYYPLNQGYVNEDNTTITTAKDSSSSGNDGVLNNFTLTGATSTWSTGNVADTSCGLYFVYNSPDVYKLNIPHTSTPAVSGGTANTVFNVSPALPAGLSLDVNTGIISGTGIVASPATDYTVTATNATTTTALINIAVTAPVPATGLKLDGVDDYIQSASDVPITGNAPRTMEITAQTDNPNAPQMLANWGAGSQANGFGLYLTNGELTFFGAGADFGTGYIVDNAWHHYAVTYDGTNVNVYVDGIATPVTNVAVALNTSNSSLLAGQFVGGGLYVQGTIDEVRVWNRALSQAEIAHNMSCQLNGSLNGLVLYYPLNQGNVNEDNTAITTAADSSGNGNNGTLLGFALTGANSNWAAGNIADSSCGLYFVYNSPDVYSLNIPHTSTPIVSGGTANTVFSISPALPAGLSLDVNTGIISGTGTAASPATDYTVTATNATTTTAIINITVTVPVAATGLNLDGVDDYIQSASDVPITGNAPRTLEITAQSDNPGADQMLANWGASSQANGFGLYITHSELTFFGAGVDFGTGYIVDNAWHHYAVTYDGTTVNVYVDGIITPTNNVAIALNTTNSSLLAGQFVGGGLFVQGTIDEVRVWDRVLTQKEIAHNMSCMLSSPVNGLVLYYPLNQGTVNEDNTAINTAADSSGNGNNGTLLGFALTGATSNWAVGNVANTSCGLYFTYKSPVVYLIGVPRTSNPTLNKSIANTTFTISPALPAGLSLDAATGVISGTGTATSPATDYTVTATDATISTAIINIAVEVPVAATGLKLDGVDDYVQSINPISITGRVDRTLEFWAKCDATGGAKVLAAWGNFNVQSAVFGLYTYQGQLYFYGEGNYDFNTQYNVDNSWHHYAVTYHDFTGYGVISVFVDGVPTPTPTGLRSLGTQSGNLYIGSDVHGLVSSASFDEVRVWNKLKTQDEIIKSMNCSLHGNQPGLVLYYPMDNGIANADNAGLTIAADSSGNNNDGTLNNFALDGSTSNWTNGVVANTTYCLFLNYPGPNAYQPGDIVNIIPTSAGTSGVVTYTISPALPAGISIDAATGIISGTAGAIMPATDFTVTATDNNGSFTAVVNIKIRIIVPATGLNFAANSNTLLSDNGVLLSGPAPRTLEFSARMDDATGKLDVSFGYTGNDDAFGVYTENSKLHFYADNYDYNTNYTIDTSWHHYAIMYDGTATKIFVDGIPAFVTPVSMSLHTGYGKLHVTFNSPVNAAATCTIDELRIWARVLTQQELTHNMNCQLNGGFQKGLIMYYQFNEGNVNDDNTGVQTCPDKSVFGNAANLIGFTLNGSASNWSTGRPLNTSCGLYMVYPDSVSFNVQSDAGVSPVISGETSGIQFSISPALPSGVVLNSSTGEIDAYADTASSARPYIITVTTNSGVYYDTIILQVNAALNIRYDSSVLTFPIYMNIPTYAPTVSGASGPYTFTISPALPSGLAFETNGGTIHGNNFITSQFGPTVYTIRVTNGTNIGVTTVTLSSYCVSAVINSVTAANNPVCTGATTVLNANVSGSVFSQDIVWFERNTQTIVGHGHTITVGAGQYQCDVRSTCDNTSLYQNIDIAGGYAGGGPTTIDSTVCASALPLAWNGLTFTQAGSQSVILPNAGNCDSVVTLNLKVRSILSSEETITRCAPYVWNGVTYTATGTYTHTFANAAGCDSTATLHLFLSNADTLRQNIATCKAFTWNGYTYRKSGVYYYRINSGGCKLVAILTLSIPRMTFAVSIAPPSCHNGANGSFTVNITSGTAPYLYKNGVSGVYQSSNTFTGIRSNVYRVYFQDANGCEGYTDSINVSNPSAITATYSSTMPTCYNTATATVTVNATGGKPPYQYKNGATGTYQSSNVFTGLSAGVTYRMYVQDANGCIGYTSLITVRETTPIAVSFTQTNVQCKNGKDGTITATAINGSAPYKYKNGVPGVYQSVGLFTSLIANNYRIYVQDANGCAGNTALVTITQPVSGCTPAPFARTAKAADEVNTNKFEVILSPNPSNDQFILKAHSNNTQPVTIRVMDVNGRNLYQSKGQTEQSFRFGSTFAPGTYLIEVRQGEEVKTVKAVKVR